MMPPVRTADNAADSTETARHRRTWFRVESIVRVGVLPRAVSPGWPLCGSCAALSLRRAFTPPTGSEGLGPTLTAIDAIRALTPQVANERRRVLIRGTITYINEREPAGIIVHDGRVAAVRALWPAYFLKQPRLELHPGDVVEVEGYTTGEGFAPAVVPEVVRGVGQSALPPARHVSYAALLSGVFDCEYIETVGVGPAGLGVRVRQDALRRHRGRRRAGTRLVLGLFAAGSHAIHRRPRDGFAATRARLYNQARQVRGVALFAGRTSGRRHRHERPPTRGRSRSARSRACTPITRWISSTAGSGCSGTVTATRVGKPTYVEDITMHSRSTGSASPDLRPGRDERRADRDRAAIRRWRPAT